MAKRKILNIDDLAKPINPEDLGIQVSKGANVQIDEQPTPPQPPEDITQKQLETLQLDKYEVMAELNTNSAPYVINSLNNELDYKQGHWHYVPHYINPAFAHEHQNKKTCIELYCTADKNRLRRLKKFIKRYSPQSKVEFYKIRE